MHKTLKNEQGFVLVAALMMLMILLIIGVAATNTTTIELQISGNDKLAKQVFYQAESVATEATRIMANDGGVSLEDPTAYTWLNLDPVTSGQLTVGAGGTEDADVRSETFWNNNSANSLLPTTGTLQMMAAFRGISPGSSLTLGSSRIHEYDVYGRSRQNNSLAIVKESFRIPF